MSDTPQGEGWWLASDGRWYPPESHPAPPPPPQAPMPPGWESGTPPYATASMPFRPIRRWVSSGLTGTLFGFLIGASALAAIGAAMYIGVYGSWSDWDRGGNTSIVDVLDMWDAADTIVGLFLLAVFVSAILTMIWGNLAYKAAQSRGATGQRWSSGWTVGAWFIPIANYVIPKLVFNEIDRMSSEDLAEPLGDTWQRARRSSVSDWWWALYVPGWLVFGVSSVFVDARAGGWLAATALGLALIAPSGILFAVFIRSVGRRLQQPRHF